MLCEKGITVVAYAKAHLKFSHIVQGNAVTGKSTLINKIVETVRETIGHDAIIVTAPTGAAAVNINGNTILSKFRIPYNLTTFKDLTGESFRKFQMHQKNLKFVIIDEM